MFKKVESQVSFPKMEEEILKFWEEQKIFEKSVSKDSPKGDFIFYEGPPTANGKPGLHHVLARAFKDIIPRYKTMQGFRVERKAGWDTHGLPVELQVEKVLGLKNKNEIENIVSGDARASVIEFNKRCKESVWEYRDQWEKLTKRMGYWVDMEHPYVTYENEYIESVWWQLAQIAELKNDKGESFLYRGHKVVPYCYRCGTALSSHEVAQGYQTVKDLSVTVEFELRGESIKTSVLAWTTTPWTLPGNVALAVGNQITYVTIEKKDEGTGDLVRFIVAKERLGAIFGEDGYKIVEEYTGDKLVGKSYKPLFDYYSTDTTLKNFENGWKIYHADFITTETGTGIAHEAPAFGEEDMELARQVGLPFIQHVSMDGTMKPEVIDFAGMSVKPKGDSQATNVAIIKYLAHAGLLFAKEKYEHEYPSCWRCDTPLIYFAKPSWFIRMSEISQALVENNEKVAWVPEHIKEGRFGEWLRGIKDWAISRERYWGTPLPIWECGGRLADNNQQKTGKQGCGRIKVISSIVEIEKLFGKKIDDVHKPYIDDATFTCTCGGVMKRTPEVMDVWFDSGAMPLAQFAYPNQVDETIKAKIEEGKYYPADYICEAVDQTRGWFYTLHAIGTLLHKGGKVPTGNAFKNVICLGHILDAQGKKMSKTKGNIVEPFAMFDKYGADALRWHLFSINQPGLPKRFDEKGMRDVMNRVFRMLWNSYSFFTTYASIDNWAPTFAVQTTNKIDRWILSELHILIRDVETSLNQYDVYSATQKIESYIDNLSNWYIRRSRKRFWKSEDDSDKEMAYQTLHCVLVTISKIMAPFTPFVTEEIFRNLTGEASVHLAKWPKLESSLIDDELGRKMKLAKEIITAGLKQRAEGGIKVRQPLGMFKIHKNFFNDFKDDTYLLYLMQEELNATGRVFEDLGENLIQMDLTITPELKLEGDAREIIRAIQEGRKKAGFNVEDRIILGYTSMERVFENVELKTLIEKEILATESKNIVLPNAEYSGVVKIEDEDFSFSLTRM